MITVEYPYAGFILPDASDLDPGPYLEAAATALSRHDSSSAPRIRPRRSQVLGQDFGMNVIPEEESDYGPRVVMEVFAADGGMPDDEIAARILSDAVLLALETSEADILEWYSPDVLIDRDDFIRLRSYVSPRRAQPEDSEDSAEEETEHETLPRALRAMLEPIVAGPDDDRPAATDRLARYAVRLEQKEPEEQRMKSAGWLLTGAVGVFAAPIAVVLFLVSLYRGMDIRLVSQAAAVTALFVVLYNTDRLQMVFYQLTH